MSYQKHVWSKANLIPFRVDGYIDEASNCNILLNVFRHKSNYYFTLANAGRFYLSRGDLSDWDELRLS